MGDEPYTTPHAISQQGSKPSTNQRLSYATDRAGILFGCYRRGDANDPDHYVAAVAAVLTLYDFELMRDVTDPRTGICTTEKYMSFMPNAGELKVYCDGVAARKERMQRLGALPPVNFNRPRLPPPEPRPSDKATIFVPASNSHYPALLEWSKSADPMDFKFEQRPGIWVSYGAWESRRIATMPRTTVEMPRLALSEDAKRAMAGVDAERSGNLSVDHPTTDQHHEAVE